MGSHRRVTTLLIPIPLRWRKRPIPLRWRKRPIPLQWRKRRKSTGGSMKTRRLEYPRARVRVTRNRLSQVAILSLHDEMSADTIYIDMLWKCECKDLTLLAGLLVRSRKMLFEKLQPRCCLIGSYNQPSYKYLTTVLLVQLSLSMWSDIKNCTRFTVNLFQEYATIRKLYVKRTK